MAQRSGERLIPSAQDGIAAAEDQHWYDVALRRYVTEVIAEDGAAPSVLDAQCGAGGMLQLLRRTFPEAMLSGANADAHALQLTAARGTGAELRQARADRLPYPAESFSHVILLDVLGAAGSNRHETIAETHRLLHPGGRVIINVGASRFLPGADKARGDVDHCFTKAELHGLLRSAGLEVQRVSLWNMIIFPAIAAVRWCARGQTATHRAPFPEVTGVLNVTLHDIALLELRAGARVPLPFGASVFAVGRKPAGKPVIGS